MKKVPGKTIPSGAVKEIIRLIRARISSVRYLPMKHTPRPPAVAQAVKIVKAWETSVRKSHEQAKRNHMRALRAVDDAMIRADFETAISLLDKIEKSMKIRR